MVPISVPSRTAIPTETNPTAMEMRAPKSIRLRTSRPSWSVPNQWVALGASRICFTS